MTTLNYSLPHLPHFVPQGDNANDIDEDPNSLSEATSKALLSNEHSQLSIHTVGAEIEKIVLIFKKETYLLISTMGRISELAEIWAK